ncbi:MAG: hydroxymethylglutaryl-CoA reductase, partial [Bacteroidetes bacterium]|nr:hydroxymethylglutaryl-CoA reductase [Bacteroidota bacterium]
MTKAIQGFSKLSKAEKQTWLAENHLENPQAALRLMQSYMHGDDRVQRQHDEFTENTIANFYMPLGVAPNFLIDGVAHSIPMATEESSVVAAAAKAASFWLHRGGFKTQVISMTKVGHVHF